MKLSYNAKRGLLLAGVAVICVGVVSLVVMWQTASTNDKQDTSSESSAELVLGTPTPISAPESSSSEIGSVFVPSSGTQASAPLTTVSKPTSAPPKPTPPASSALTDKSKKPTYSSKPTASKSSTSKVTSAPKGKSYMPGFGYVDGTGGGQGTQDKITDHDGDINKQVGTMD